jgi:hemin uptake protein HemP
MVIINQLTTRPVTTMPSAPAASARQSPPSCPVGQAVAAPSAPDRNESGVVDSTAILRGRKAVEIKHNGSTYRLQATRLGKLILTK